jgi:site-specific DNA-methyltransferase (adenine-specific)
MPMTPYYDEDGITIYHGDSREIMPLLAPVEAVFADPPYNVGLRYLSHDDKMGPTEYRAWSESWFKPALDICDGAVVITPGMVSVPMWMEIEPTHKLIAWTKANNNSRNYIGPTSGYQCWEPILVYGKSLVTVLRDWIDCPIALQPFDGHPCPKPIKLMRWIVENFTPLDGTILDPFAGSGSTLRAAKDLGRTAIGIEIDERYCELAVQRLAQGVLPLSNGSIVGSKA